METSFIDWTLERIVGKLTKAEVIACLPMGWIHARDVRTWKTLEDAVLHLSDNMKSVIYEAACTKNALMEEVRIAGRKRKRENRAWGRRTRRCLSDDDFDEGACNKFLELASEEELRSCFRNFREVSSNEGLKMYRCVVCARELGADAGGISHLLDDPSNRALLQPLNPHPAQVLWKGALVLGEAMERSEDGYDVGWICTECGSALRKEKTPRLSLANDLWIGDIPLELAMLTIPEQLLVARHYPRCYVFKLYPRERGHLNVEQMQRGMKGNVSLYELNTNDVVKMLEGQMMPNSVSSMASVLAITYVGSMTLPKDWLKSTFRVRRRVVYEALCWLKRSNSLYRDICIEEGRLQMLPEDGVPDEILSLIRQEDDNDVVEREHESYVNLSPELNRDERNIGDEKEDTDFDQHGDVVPLQFIGVEDVDASLLSSNDLLLHAMTNLKNEDLETEGGYAVRHGRIPVFDLPIGMQDRQSSIFSDKFDALAAAFPVLWPYGEGRWDVHNRSRKLSFSEYVRWALQYYDKRFRTHHAFPFVAFGIEQKAKALYSAKLQMHRRDFDHDAISLATMTIDDLRRAEAEEDEHHVVSNEHVKKLRRHVYAVGGRVMGSKNSRAGYRSQIWSACLRLGPPSLWITINPLDYDDPVAQVFAGENIDMDHFVAIAGPDSIQRGINIAKDPYAAAKFFRFIINTTLETLMGIKTTRCLIASSKGVLGVVSGYFGVVEAQGRGSLHVHMLAWLKDVPNADEMMELLRNVEFRERIGSYLRANIHADLEGFDEGYVDTTTRQTGVTYSRPIDPDESRWKERFEETERVLARTYQVHECKTSTCLRRDRYGKLVCKRHAPWPLEEETMVEPNGTIHLARRYGFLNGYCPGLLVGCRCNIDTKFISNGEETKDSAWYCTGYALKEPEKSYNQSALLAKGFMFHQGNVNDTMALRDRNRLLVYRCFNSLNQQSELSGPQVISYLMGWGDVFRSHRFAAVYWTQLAHTIKRQFPSLRNDRSLSEESRENHSQSYENDERRQRNDDNEIFTFASDSQGRLYTESQVQDYVLRPVAFDDMNFLDFTVETYDGRKEDGDEEEDESRRHRVGRTKNLRGEYLSNHPKFDSHIRIERSENHNYLPNIVGPWFPRRDSVEEEEFYYASVLALLQPWRNLQELKGDGRTWKEEGLVFLERTSGRQRNVIAGMQYYYDSRSKAQSCNQDVDIDEDRVDEGDLDDVERNVLNDDESEDVHILTEDEVDRYEELQKYSREHLHGMLAVEAGRLTHILPDDTDDWEISISNDARRATYEDLANLNSWKNEMEKMMQDELRLDNSSNIYGDFRDEGQVVPIQQLLTKMSDGMAEGGQEDDETDVSSLNEEQRRAYDIVDAHLQETLLGVQPSQLRMVIPGEGGTGKSRTIRAITANFERLHVNHILVKGAYTGIAASIVDGRTLHVLTGMPLKGVRSAKTMKRLTEFWRSKKYLIIDEMSMLSRQFLAKLSNIITTVLCCDENGDVNLPFGGLNVVLVGDFHQFPPVVSGRAASLYYLNDPHIDSTEAVIGREIYEQFTTVVQLRTQVRVVDPVWNDLLQHVRYGNCRERHINLLRSLIITNPNSPKTNYDEEPWKSAVLVTPRHGVRRLWNTAAAKKACVAEGRTLYISSAIDMIGGQPLSLADRFGVLTKVGHKKDGGEERAGLMKAVELAIGMPIMVTWNVHTELDIANGSRGEIVGVMLHPEESQEGHDEQECLQKLIRPPSYVLVRLERTKMNQLPGLPPQVIPISPITKTFSINVAGVNKVVSRTQLPITPAYAFTDYRAQGQTIVPVIVDIGRPPTGGITPFNIYVALSRAKGRESIRLLRDFDEVLLQQHPSEYLRVEDERLQKLDEKTKAWWEQLQKTARCGNNDI